MKPSLPSLLLAAWILSGAILTVWLSGPKWAVAKIDLPAATVFFAGMASAMIGGLMTLARYEITNG